MKYKKILEEQEKIGGRWKTKSKSETDYIMTYKNINMATSKETLKFFRRLGSRQVVEHKGFDVIIYSYSPVNSKHRNKITFEVEK